MDDDNRNHNNNDSYYYSYGRLSSESTSNGHEDTTPVEISQSPPMRSFSYSSGEHGSGSSGSSNWSQPRNGLTFKGAFAAFLAGALVVGSLMFAADKMNLFTGSNVFAESLSENTGSAVETGGGTSADIVRPNTIADMVASASPAVVKIETFVKSSQRGNASPYFSNDDIFRYFFGDSFGSTPPPSQNKNGDTKRTAGLGSGFIFDKSGYILTNEHVVSGADEIEVTVEGYKENFKAKLLGTAPDLDLAVIKIEGSKEFSTLNLGSSESMRVGDWVTAIGNPMGFDHTVSVGVVSAKEREISIPDQRMTRVYKHLLQTDASINPGNSGGPLLNLNGEVVGINTAVSAQAQGIGFAIPTSTITSVLDNLKNNVKVPRPFIGISMQDIQKEWLSELKLDGTDGVLVRAVVQGGPADKAGLKPYDVITTVNGEKVSNGSKFQDKVKTLKVGDKVTMTIVRDGKAMSVGVTVGDQNDN